MTALVCLNSVYIIGLIYLVFMLIAFTAFFILTKNSIMTLIIVSVLDVILILFTPMVAQVTSGFCGV